MQNSKEPVQTQKQDRLPYDAAREYQVKEKILVNKRAEAHRVALAIAERDRSDPFIYGRIYTQVMNGLQPECELPNK